MRVLVVDDEQIKRVSLVDDLRDNGYHAVGAVNGAEALEMLAERPFDVVVTDLRMPEVDGMAVLKHVKRNNANTSVVMMTAYGSIPLAVEAMKQGAYNFITKPFRNEVIIPLLERIGNTSETDGGEYNKREVDLGKLEDIVVGHSAAMREVRKMAELCSRNDATVLLTGETGVGKDLVAGAIHRLSYRRDASFVKANCSVFASHLIESALFGHVKGAFTGAEQQASGKFDMAQGGTIYLDDVDDVPFDQQIKLLRVIEEKVYERVGSPRTIEADVRIIASTKKNLLEMTENNLFRSDLYYRLNVLRIDLPALRERIDDMPELVECLLNRIAGDEEYTLAADVQGFLRQHSWPGNVRELAHALERAFLTGRGMITVKSLWSGESGARRPPAARGRFKDVVMETERQLLEQALKQTGGNKSAAARMLGMKFSTLRDKLAKHGFA